MAPLVFAPRVFEVALWTGHGTGNAPSVCQMVVQVVLGGGDHILMVDNLRKNMRLNTGNCADGLAVSYLMQLQAPNGLRRTEGRE